MFNMSEEFEAVLQYLQEYLFRVFALLLLVFFSPLFLGLARKTGLNQSSLANAAYEAGESRPLLVHVLGFEVGEGKGMENEGKGRKGKRSSPDSYFHKLGHLTSQLIVSHTQCLAQVAH